MVDVRLSDSVCVHAFVPRAAFLLSFCVLVLCVGDRARAMVALIVAGCPLAAMALRFVRGCWPAGHGARTVRGGSSSANATGKRAAYASVVASTAAIALRAGDCLASGGCPRDRCNAARNNLRTSTMLLGDCTGVQVLVKWCATAVPLRGMRVAPLGLASATHGWKY